MVLPTGFEPVMYLTSRFMRPAPSTARSTGVLFVIKAIISTLGTLLY